MSSAFYSFIGSITNSITSKYDVKSQVSSSGLWKIYQGQHKTTGKKVSLFIFEKKSLDANFKRDRGSSKHSNEIVYELLKKEAGNLAKLRHPSILEIVEPVSESRSSIVFVTEPLMGALTHLVKSADTYSSDSEEPGLDLDELEIQKGLLQVGKGLQFFNDVKVVHHNLTTDAVFVNTKGDWKIGGLGFSVFLNSENTNNAEDEHHSDYLPESSQVNLDYAAPEFVLENNVCQANDMFSLGCLAYAVHNKGVSLLKTFNSHHTYEKQIKQINSSQTFQSTIPAHLQPVIQALLVRHPNQRMTPQSFQNSKYFDNLLVSTMKFLENFPEKTREEKAQFMKGLPRVLGQFPERVLKRKIMPSLLEELKDAQLLPYTIPNVFVISQNLSQQEFCDLVLPSLKPVFNVRDPPQHMIVLLEKLDVLQQKTSRELFRDDVMPLVYAALEAPTAVVQEKALRIIPSLAESLDYTTVKSSLFPRVQNVFTQTTILSVKVSTLICFHSIIKALDKFTVQEKLVPILKNIKTKEPAVMLATLAVYDEIGKVADKEVIATEILPQLWRMSFGPLLNLEQFQKFMRTIRELTKRVEEAHTKYLQEVKSLEEQTKNVSTTNSPQTVSIPAIGDVEVSFESLVGGGGNNDIFGSMGNNKTSISPLQQNNVMTPQRNFANNSNDIPSLFPNNQQQQSSIAASNNNTNNWMASPSRQQIPDTTTTTNTWNTTNNNNSNNNNTLWSQSLQAQKIMSTATNKNAMNPIPSLTAPPSFQQNNHLQQTLSQMSLKNYNNNNNNNMDSSGNYNALRGLTSQQQQHQQQPNMMPLASNMGLLKPLSPVSNNARLPNNTSQNTKLTNLHAFDPLG